MVYRRKLKYPQHTDFFVLEQKKVEVKPRFAEIVEKEPNRRGGFTKNHQLVEFYTESGTLLYLPDGPRYRYRRDEVRNCIGAVESGQVVSAGINDHNRWASCVWSINRETFFDDIPQIDGLIARVERGRELGNVEDAEYERVMPLIRNQRISHEILVQVLEEYSLHRNQKVKLYAKRCPAFGPTECTDNLGYTILCYVGEAFYKSREAGPYHGQRIAHIEFPGIDMLRDLVREKVFGIREKDQ